MSVALAGTEDHAQARIVLSAALAAGPSHAYLFHGPAGTGKRTVARAFAAELLAEGADDPDAVRLRVQHGTHPDLTWVRPSGAHVMRVEDVDGPVVGAATRTPFEARRRVFVLERVDTMNDEVANRLLKTLEEPAHFVHLILLTDALGRVIETVVSRCQPVRFEPAAGGADRRRARGRRRAGRARELVRAAGAGQRRARPTARVAGGRSAARRGRGVRRRGARGRAGGELEADPRSGRERSRRGRGGGGRGGGAAARDGAEGTRAPGDRSASSRTPASATAAAPAPRCSTWR